MSHPGKNVTGITTLNQDLQAKRVQLLRELVPGARNIGLLFAPEAGAAATYRHETEAAAKAMGLTTHVAEVRKADDLNQAFASLSASHVQAAILVPSSFFNSLAARITALAAQHRIPTVYPAFQFVAAGGLLVYEVDLRAAITRAADYVDRILKGALPGELPVDQLAKLELVINMKAAKALGIKIPPSIMARADRLIE
jgi:putative ABC transport system substrate-binding protein